MSKEKENHFNVICRTCGFKSECLEDLFSLENGVSFAEMIQLCTRVPIIQADDRPNGICRTCIVNLRISYDFYFLVRGTEDNFIALQVPTNLSPVKVKVELPEDSEEMPEHVLTIEPIFMSAVIVPNTTETPERKRRRPPKVRPNINIEPPSKIRSNFYHQKKLTNPSLNLNTFECYKCKIELRSLTRVRVHLREHDPKHNCRICLQRYTKQDFQKHICNGQQSIHCDQCTESFESTINLVHHLNSQHQGGDNFKCYKCGRNYGMKSLLEFHKKCHPSEEKKFICDICGMRARTKYLIKEHLEIMHTNKRGKQSVHCPMYL